MKEDEMLKKLDTIIALLATQGKENEGAAKTQAQEKKRADQK